MAASLWLQLPAPPATAAALHSYGSSSSSLICKKNSQARGSLLCRSTSSSSSVVTKEQKAVAAASSQEEEVAAVPEPEFVSYRDVPNFRGCRGCGREEVERGCNGEGRIQGGIATVPGFSWWPIKAYRPCPGFVASGGRYRRQGQSMDDVASGRGKKLISLGFPTRSES
ncbi:hypothetical protein E2562_020926 [Oryza meyeriana var. granulata]|uniref:Uncharacterized protein n=1 Tax=Oryza meyeriana var. granulata TaxID=110450 RepID=A0A6G1DYG9_9ORYZ|nr:hypothetical protein E2562_020926 [Oryza meyeriana var. granulata]